MAKDYLANLGVAQQGLSTISYVKNFPYVTSTMTTVRQKNRHDRFVIKPA